MGALMLGLYLVAGFATDIMLLTVGVKPYLSVVAGLVVLVLFVISGRPLRSLKTTSGKLWLVLMIWLIVDIPFSYWPGGSAELLEAYLPKVAIVLFFIGALVVTIKDCRTIFLANVIGSFAVLFECVKWGALDNDGRFSIEHSMLLQNPNDLALQLVVSLGFFVYLILNRGKLSRILGLAGLFAGVYYMISTGSRGSLLALIVVTAFCIFFTPYRQKVLMMMAPMCLIFLTMSGSTLHRLTLIFVNPTESDASNVRDIGSIGSQMERTELLKASLKYMIFHPLFGVGPGQFNDTRWADMKMKGTHVASLGTHNSYTEMGSESGIPALICFAGVVILSVRSNYRIYKRSLGPEGVESINQLSFCLLLSCLAFAVNAVFHHSAYGLLVPFLGGLSISVHLAAEPILKQREYASRPAGRPGVPLR
jgi:O-antigen ligase